MPNSHQTLIAHYLAAGTSVRAAVAGLTDTQAKLIPPNGPGKWSIHQNVIHLADADAVAIDRMKRILSEDRPSILSFDEDAYLARLHPHDQSLEDALVMIELGRRQFTKVLTKLDDADFLRIGLHNRAGDVSVLGIIQGQTEHVHHHLKFVMGKREKLRI